MAAKKKAKRKARTWVCVPITEGGTQHRYLQPLERRFMAGCVGCSDWLVLREILPRTPAKRKGGRR